MRHLVPILALGILAFAGCSTERQLNPGGHPAMVVMNHKALAHEYGSVKAIGFRGNSRIGLSNLLNQDQMIANAIHEFAHEYVRRTGDERIWNVVDDLGGEPELQGDWFRFPVHCDEYPLRRFPRWGMSEEAQQARAVYQALRASRSVGLAP